MQNNLNYGQHFLKSEKVLNELINTANITKNENILEIGGGLGIVTKELTKKAKSVTVVEIDETLKQALTKIEKECKNVKIIYQNALLFNFKQFKKIVTSLPYNIIEPFIKKCVKEKVEDITMLIGDSYALSLKENLQNLSSATYLQLLTLTFFDCELICFVEKECFSPPPRTGSYIVKLVRKDVQKLDDLHFILQEMFLQQDKKIKNALIESFIRLKGKKYNENLTQKQSKSIINSLSLSNQILDSYLTKLNNTEITEFFVSIKKNLENSLN